MSQTKVFSVSSGTTTRTRDDGTDGQGCGNSKHLYVGKYGTGRRNYDSYLKFSTDWSNVAKIISATLSLYTDEYNSNGSAFEPGIMPAPGASDTPKVVVYRLTSAFTEGNNADGVFDASDFTKPKYTTSGAKSHAMLPAGANQLHEIDITDIVRSWAPSTVAGGGSKSNYGIALLGRTSNTENWSGWSEDHTGGGGASEHPTITVVYELGPTTPSTPSNLTPSGNVGSLTAFEGDFSDAKVEDELYSVGIEIYDEGHDVITISTTQDRVSTLAHGLKQGDVIYFTSLTGGVGLSTFTKYYVRGVTTNSFQCATTNSDSTIVDVTTAYTGGTWNKKVLAYSRVTSEAERAADHFVCPVPSTLSVLANTSYGWRVRYSDNEGKVSSWSSLVTFTVTNAIPAAPVPYPDGLSYASLNLVKFSGGTFSDPDGDTLLAHQVQLSPFAEGDIRWDEADSIYWDSGKQYDVSGTTIWEQLYTGPALLAGTYHWRARNWDQRDGVSAWAYATITLTQDFSPDPGTYSAVQINPNAPWRIVIRDLYQPDGVTKTVGRGPGNVVAVLEEAKNIGSSLVYNSPGEIHFTLLKDDPQLSVIEPKQVHYAVEFYSGDGWQEKFAGVVWDVDGTDTDVVFKGIDYLALYDTIIDERYDPLKPNKSYTKNGSYYEDVKLRTVVIDQLNRAKKLANSWVGFIKIGAIATMNEKVTIYSTMQPTLSFIAGLLDSHRQGTGKRTRMKVVKTSTGTYELQIVDDPGVQRDDLALHYGELVQGYRVIIFGDGWANVQHVVGRNREGSKVTYKTIKDQAYQPAQTLYGRIATVAVMDGVMDQSDLNRRGKQAAIASAKLGKNVALGIRTQSLPVLQGWDITDVFPVVIADGGIFTANYGSGLWASFAVAWEATDIGQQSMVITLMPKEDAESPDPDLIPSVPLSTQPEWQLGWTPPDPLKASSKYWLDQTTGKVYVRDDSPAVTIIVVSGTA